MAILPAVPEYRRPRGRDRGLSMASPPIPLLEAYFAHWFKTSEAGRRSVALLGFDSAMDALFETLNAAFIKLESDSAGFSGIAPCFPPQPPVAPIICGCRS